MKHYLTSKAELLFVVLPKDAYDVHMVEDLGHTFVVFKRPNRPLDNIEIPEGYTLLGSLTTIPEDVAKGLVDGNETGTLFEDYILFRGNLQNYFDTALESLTSIATHLGMDTNENIYILKRI